MEIEIIILCLTGAFIGICIIMYNIGYLEGTKEIEELNKQYKKETYDTRNKTTNIR